MTDGVDSFYLWEMDSTLTHKIWSPQNLLLRDGVRSIYSRNMESTTYTHDSWSKLHLLIRYGVHDMYSFTHNRWNAQYLLTTNGVYSIYTWEMQLLLSSFSV